jgi:hypothetical protein
MHGWHHHKWRKSIWLATFLKQSSMPSKQCFGAGNISFRSGSAHRMPTPTPFLYAKEGR